MIDLKLSEHQPKSMPGLAVSQPRWNSGQDPKHIIVYNIHHIGMFWTEIV
jgi:hypothetical protein